MRVKRTGGFTGVQKEWALEVSSLGFSEADKFLRLFNLTNFFLLPSESEKKSLPDEFFYEITVEHEGRNHVLRRSESAMSPELKQCCDWVSNISKNMR